MQILQKARRRLERHGAAHTAFALVLRALNAFVTLKILRAAVVERPEPGFLVCPPGYCGLVSYVEAENFDSLKSCFRMGYALFGSVFLVKLFGRYFSWASPGCRRFEFRVAPLASAKGAGLLFGKN